jgi:hypothetical protein
LTWAHFCGLSPKLSPILCGLLRSGALRERRFSRAVRPLEDAGRHPHVLAHGACVSEPSPTSFRHACDRSAISTGHLLESFV